METFVALPSWNWSIKEGVTVKHWLEYRLVYAIGCYNFLVQMNIFLSYTILYMIYYILGHILWYLV